VEAGLDVRCPCLVLHAQRSLRPSAWTGEIHQADVVLDVEDIRRLAPQLGSQVEVQAIPGGIHDLVLSPPEARARTFQVLGEWMDRHFPG
jgi:alpha-beta hydrolase superfamily lysophospholipase